MLGRTFRYIAFVSLFGVPLLLAPSAEVQSESCGSRSNNTYDKLLECVTVDGAAVHLEALQQIADAHNGNRASGTSGYDASAEYAVGVLTASGYNVSVQPFQFQTFLTLQPTLLERVSPPPAGSVASSTLQYSGSGDVTAPVSVPSGFPGGCSASDFAGFTPGHIALLMRTPNCFFSVKATNAFNAGAVGVIFYNDAPGTLEGTLGSNFSLNIPVVGVTAADGLALRSTPGLVMRIRTSTFRGTATSYNIIAETASGDPESVVMAGAHLDSVFTSPGVQDNGSGAAAILEVAKHIAKANLRNKVRFALWGAEEVGLAGSNAYLLSLPQAEQDKIVLYLNFDMIASPNHGFFIYDGDDSDAVGAGPGPEGSAQIERTFEAFYASRDIPVRGTDFTGRSDYGPFISLGIPSGGIFTGADGIKTVEETELWGGTAGIPYDPCYHKPCDTYANINITAMDTNIDAVAYAVLRFAMNTEDVNGTRPKGNFPIEAGVSITSSPDLQEHDAVY